MEGLVRAFDTQKFETDTVYLRLYVRADFPDLLCYICTSILGSCAYVVNLLDSFCHFYVNVDELHTKSEYQLLL